MSAHGNCTGGCCVSKHVTGVLVSCPAYNDPGTQNTVPYEVCRADACRLRVTLTNRGTGSNKVYFGGSGDKNKLTSNGASAPNQAAYILPGETITLETEDSIWAVADETNHPLMVIIHSS